MDGEFDRYYPKSSQPYKGQLQQFRRTHPVIEMIIHGVRWNYYCGGHGPETILVLHGGGGPAESLFRYIQAFETDYRVIAPTVPARVNTVAAVMDAALAILEHEKTGRVHIFGVSNGGMIGQCLVRRAPSRFSSLVLFISMLPSSDYAAQFTRRAKMMSLLPGWVITRLGLHWIKKHVQSEADNAAPGELAFWRAYFDELYASDLITRDYFVSRAKILTDYFGGYHFHTHDLDKWYGRIFIMESENDQVVNARERERLKHHYPEARVHTFKGTGHMGGGLFMVEDTVKMTKEFLLTCSKVNHETEHPFYEAGFDGS
jgi:pimeloyl-ACP methyl ester carboxylesterase